VNEPQWIVVAALLGASGMWLLLPRGGGRGWIAGAVLTAVALAIWTLVTLGVWAWQVPLLGEGLKGWMAQGTFGMLAAVTLVAAIATVTMRNPVYCAIWFGMSLMGTAGLFLFAGAQFLAVATVVVYAGAILVTFLFVLMLARPGGRAAYDRVSWEALVSAALGMVIVGMLSKGVSDVLIDDAQPVAVSDAAKVAEKAAGDRTANVLAEQHIVHFSAELFGRHLIAIEVAGTLLLAALVGAAVIVGQSKTDQPEQPPADSQ
jgi:NADH-quinone oxidoreductase subunit J